LWQTTPISSLLRVPVHRRTDRRMMPETPRLRKLGLWKLGLRKLGLRKLGLRKLGLRKLGFRKLGLWKLDSRRLPP